MPNSFNQPHLQFWLESYSLDHLGRKCVMCQTLIKYQKMLLKFPELSESM